ncbi:hypothetical protein B0H19DRAFT_1175418, partial [Mycena capillaripes]
MSISPAAAHPGALPSFLPHNTNSSHVPLIRPPTRLTPSWGVRILGRTGARMGRRSHPYAEALEVLWRVR